MHTITWCHEQTLEAAQQTADDINAGMVRGTRAWVEVD